MALSDYRRIASSIILGPSTSGNGLDVGRFVVRTELAPIAGKSQLIAAPPYATPSSSLLLIHT